MKRIVWAVLSALGKLLGGMLIGAALLIAVGLQVKGWQHPGWTERLLLLHYWRWDMGAVALLLCGIALWMASGKEPDWGRRERERRWQAANRARVETTERKGRTDAT